MPSDIFKTDLPIRQNRNVRPEFRFLENASIGLKSANDMANGDYPTECTGQWDIRKDSKLIEWFESDEEAWRGIKSKCFVWGSGRHGQLGSLTHAGRHCSLPKHLTEFDNNQTIELGLNCTFMITSSGTVYSCGEGSYGRLGHGNSDDLNTATLISALQGFTIIKISSSKGSDGHTLALSESGEVFSWGDGDYGKL